MTQEIRLFGAIAVRPAVLAALPRFEVVTGHAIACKWALNPAVAAQIEAGEPFDLAITNPHLIEALVAAGKVAAGAAPFGRIAMGVAARAGTPPIDLSSVAAFADTLKRAGSIAYASEGSSGAYFLTLLERLGIADVVRPHRVGISGAGTASAVGTGDAELAVVPIMSILAAEPAVVLAGRFPAELQSYIEFAIGISTLPSDISSARQLRDFLTSTAVREALAEKGLEPPTA